MLTANNFFQKITSQLEKQYPVVVFRTPNSKAIKAYLQNSADCFQINDFSESGFAFYPFDTNCHLPLYIPRNDSEYLEIDTPLLASSSLNFEAQKSDNKNFVDLIEKAKKEIDRSFIEKVVVSRTVNLKYNNLDPVDALKNLLNDYPNQYVYLWYHPLTGIWLGASPERFLNVNKKRIKTVSLAGTRPVTDKNPRWGEKEIREHKIVTNFIFQVLKKYTDSQEISKLLSTKSGNMWHLLVKFSGKLKKDTNLKNLLYALHPTPAVCGVPKQESKSFIHENENYDRAYYTGFLGEINTQGVVNLYVNLRCTHLEKKSGRLFVGAGITSDSIAQDEWQETQNKTQTIMNSLRGILTKNT